MKRYPSLKTIRKTFPNLSEPEVLQFRSAFDSIGPLQVINGIIGGYGVEHIQKGHNSKSPAIDYVNMGDTYAATVMYVNGRYRIGNWGDIVERGNYD